MIAEHNLINLGFDRNDETPESSGSDNNWYYYTFSIGDFTLISKASDEIDKDCWNIYIFDFEEFEFTEVESLIEFINILKKNIKK